MSKRRFREPAPVAAGDPCYPTLESFDQASRRSFLSRLGILGAALLGAGALAACDHRAAPAAPPDGGPPPKPDPDFGIAGGARPNDAELDKREREPRPDGNMIEGDVAGPDARIDDLEVHGPMGYAPMMDARVDGCEIPDPKPTP
jgi:hypothetical protein